MHVRCPHCHNPIEIVEQAELIDIPCPSCGSSFSLISGETTAAETGSQRSVGHFQLIERVGVGAFGSVWKARDEKLDRTVALKIPRKDQLSKPEAELFFREARSAAQLRHPGIVGVHEVGREGDTLYIVSDFVQGATLKEWLSAQRLSPRESAELCVKVTEALHHAHEAGIVHRDLKPGNIMMTAKSEPQVTDFGLARRESGEITMTLEGQVLGTPAYMSPEQARGEGHTVDRRADVYSLGVILFELLTGQLPFRGDKRMLLVQILKDEPPAPRKLDNRIPRDLQTICLKCLEKAPEGRYESAAELAADLNRYLAHEPILARPIGQAARLIRWCRRQPQIAALLLTVFVVSLSGIAVSTLLCPQGVSASNDSVTKRNSGRHQGNESTPTCWAASEKS